MKRSAAIAAVAAVIVVGLFALARTDAGQLLLGRWSFTKSIVVDHGYYFRLKVKLAYKGEPQDFDIVVGCNVRVATYKDNSNTYEAGLVPTVFGRRMSDGKGLVVRPPDACPGQTTANGKVPKEFIPLIIVYDDATTMAFGTAYMTEDAYHNPLSELTFGQATIETATRADFDAFRARETNIVTPQMYFADSEPELKKRGLLRPAVMFGGVCMGYARFRLIGGARAAAQILRPSAHPKYWVPSTEEYWVPSTEEEAKISDAWPAKMMQSDRDGAVLQSRDDLYASFDSPANSGIAMLSGAHPLFSPATIPATVYPDIGGWVRLPWPRDPGAAAEALQRSGPRVGASVDYRNGTTLGFAYCWVPATWYPPLLETGEPPLRQSYNAMPGRNLVDGIDAFGEWHGAPSFIIEDDEFMLTRFQFYLDSVRGDV